MKKLISIAIALFVVAAVAVPSANALTTADLQAQITALLAQLSTLQGQLSALQGSPTGTPANCAGITFNRNLARGVSGSDVKCMQTLLNQLNVNVADTGAGSPGNETSYFGGATRAAVIRFQELYRSEVLAPSGLTAGTGFVGPATRAKLNTILGSGSGPVIPPIVPTGAGLNTALAVDNPVSSTLVSGTLAADGGQSVAPLAKFTFVNGDNAEAKVTQLKLKRIGVSADATLTNVYLFDGATRLTDAASVSSGIISFNDSTGLFKVAAGSSKVITVRADIAGAASGQTVGVSLNAAADITSTASAVTGTFPITGNLMSIATGSLSGVSFQLGTSTTPTAASIDPQNDYAIWQNYVTITTRSADLTRISFREIGSVTYTDLQNFRLYIDGIAVGAAVQNLDLNGYVTFDLSAAPKRLEAGTRVFKVLADIIGGSSKTFSLQLKTAADANFVDSQYNVTVLPKANDTTFTAVRSCYNGSTLDYGCTVNSGVVTVTKKTDSPSGNIVKGATNATLGTFEVKAAGERVKIESLDVAVVCSRGGTATDKVGYLRNGILLANGTQIGSTSNLNCTAYSTTYTAFNLGSSLIVDPGSPVILTVKADIYDNDGTDNMTADDTLQARIVADTGNAQGIVSSATINVPGTTVNANSLTVATGALTAAKYTAFANQTYVATGSSLKLAHFTLTANTTEDVNVSTIAVDLTTVTYSNVTNLYVTYGTAQTSTKATTAAANSWNVNYLLPHGQTVDVIVYGTIASGYTNGVASHVDLTVSGTTTGSATAVCTGGAVCTSAANTDGQNLLFSAGSLTSAVDGGTPVAQVVAGNQTITTGKYKFTAASDNFTITEVKAKVGSAAISAVIDHAVLKDGTTVLKTATYDPTNNYYFTGLNVAVARDTIKTLTVDLVLVEPSADYSTTQLDVKTSLDWFKYIDSAGTQSTSDTDRDGNSIYVVKSLPTFTSIALGSSEATALASGATTTLSKFSVGASSQGEVNLKQLKFNVTLTNGSGGTPNTMSTFKFFRGATDITNLVSIQENTSGKTLESTTTITDGTNVVVVTFDTEEVISAGATTTFALKATPANFLTNSTGADTVSTVLNGDTPVSSDTSLFYVYTSATGGIQTGLSTAIQQLATDNSAGGAIAENIIWSDHSALGHSYTTAASSADWMNSMGTYLGLPLDSQGIVCP